MPVSLSRRTVLIGAAVVAGLALAVTLAVVLTGGSGAAPDAPLVRPVAEKDVVPKLRTFDASDIPKSCGISAKTVKRYAPGDHGKQDRASCHWYSLNSGAKNCPGICPASGGDRERVLDVHIERTPHTTSSRGDSEAGAALRALQPAPATRVAAGRPPRPVTGLGDEAYYSYSAALSNPGDKGGTLAFRTGTALISVTYDGRTWGAKGKLTQVPESEARPALFAAATDVARALGVSAAPRFGDPVSVTGQPPVRRVPRPCDLVPPELARRLAPGAERRRTAQGLASNAVVYGAGQDSCTWDSTPTCCLNEDTDHRPERHLTVTVRSVTDWRRGIGTWLARRDFLAEYHDAREGRGRSRFQRVRGLGDEAYTVAHGPLGIGASGGGANVAFRYRNVIVLVDYTGGKDGSPRPDEAVNAAYTVAVRARAALPA